MSKKVAGLFVICLSAVVTFMCEPASAQSAQDLINQMRALRNTNQRPDGGGGNRNTGPSARTLAIEEENRHIHAANEQFDKGMDAYRNGDYAAALAFFQNAEAESSFKGFRSAIAMANSAIANTYGVAAERRGDYAAELAYFQQALGFFKSNIYRKNIEIAKQEILDAQIDAQKKLRQQQAKTAQIQQAQHFGETLTVADSTKGLGFGDPLVVDVPTPEKQVFLKNIQEDATHYNNQLQKLMDDVNNINVPPPASHRTIHEGIILGLFNTHEKNAITDTSKNVVSPFTGKKYKADEYFATSDNLTANELLRGVLDNGYLGEYTLNTPYGKALVEKLGGTNFDRLIAHSNGATVTEALIRKGTITVNELNIIGGDRSLINVIGLNELIASGKVKRVVVWINPGDIIPYGTSAGLMSPLAGARDQYIKTAADYITEKLTGQAKGGDAKVEYRFLKGDQYHGQNLSFGKDVFDAHGLDVYCYNMQKYFETHQ